MLVLMIAAMLGGPSAGFAYDKHRLRRRAPSHRHRRFAGFLISSASCGSWFFYDGHAAGCSTGITSGPPRHQTPKEFGDSLFVSCRPARTTRFRRLTRIFYRIRFGGAELNQAKQRRLARVLQQLSTMISATGKKEDFRERDHSFHRRRAGARPNRRHEQCVDQSATGRLAAWRYLRHMTVADDQAAIERAIRNSAAQCDYLFISGGDWSDRR